MRLDNRRARYDYEILETLEAGIDLLGPEVKSVREGKISLEEAFIHFRDGQAFLVNAHIHPYQNSLAEISPTRPRRLLLHKKQILSLAQKSAQNGLTVIPLAVYNKGNLLKLEIALARGKKTWDKREALKKRDIQRDLENLKL